MNEIEKIKAEIERLYNDKYYSEDRWDMGYDCACEDMISFLDTLSEESDKSLEEEIDRFEDWMETYNQVDYPTSFTTRDIARHFAQWGAEHLKK